MKTYLHIVPPWYAFQPGLRQPDIPLGAAYCARAALAAGWEALIWNGDLLLQGKENQYSLEMASYHDYLVADKYADDLQVWMDLRELLHDYKPDVVGITVRTPAYNSFKNCVRIIREELPKARVIAGGPHISALPDEPLVDRTFVGEGEERLMDYLGRPGKFDGWPARSKVYNKYGLMNRDNYGTILFGRGCPFPCSFCGSHHVWGRKTKWRDGEDVAAEMQSVYKEYDTRYFSFADDTFTLSDVHTVNLTMAIENTDLLDVPGFRWTCNTRPELIDQGLVHILKDAGCSAIAIGIESGSARILRKMKKNFGITEVREAVTIIRDAGLIVSGQFMIGYPTEIEEEMWDTVKLARELKCESVMLSVAAPLPGTELFDEAVALGLIDPNNIDWEAVTTKNDGILMTIPNKHKVLEVIRKEFDDMQAETLPLKEASRRKYEAQYIEEGDLPNAY